MNENAINVNMPSPRSLIHCAKQCSILMIAFKYSRWETLPKEYNFPFKIVLLSPSCEIQEIKKKLNRMRKECHLLVAVIVTMMDAYKWNWYSSTRKQMFSFEIHMLTKAINLDTWFNWIVFLYVNELEWTMQADSTLN